MQYNTLGNSNLTVSRIGLGTMTWGEQNTEAEAHAQMDYALAKGVTFWDTAEMYPVPPQEETQGRTERYIGTWLKKSGLRDQIVLASKVSGPGERSHYLRGGPQLTRVQIHQALHDSLQRLQTDYLDLYQVHWPERKTNFFGKLGYEADNSDTSTPLLETLAALGELVEAGKVRYIGISNETAWGAMTYLRLAEQQGLPRIISVQNPYNLLNRSYEVGLAEVSHREQVSLLAYSPLAFGALSGKYLNNARPVAARMTLFPRFSRYFNPAGVAATEEYVSLAREHGLDPVHMALAYVNSRPFLGSNLIGATTMAQLRVNIDSINLVLDEAVVAGIDNIHARHSNPCP